MAGTTIYRDFDLRHDPMPIPLRGADWIGVHKNYDPTPTYFDDSPADDRWFRGASEEDVRRQIDDWYLEQE